MIIEFSVENYRSIREEQVLSLEALPAGTCEGNCFLALEKTRLLKSAVVYGPNASGKSNIVRAFFVLNNFVLNSTDMKNGQPIIWYDSFRLNNDCREQAISIKIDFINTDNIRYNYSVCFNNYEIEEEILDYYPKGYKANLFTRNFNEIKLGPKFENKRIDKQILPNHLFLSKAVQ